MTFELHIWVILGFPFFGYGSHFFGVFFLSFDVVSRFSSSIDVEDL